MSPKPVAQRSQRPGPFSLHNRTRTLQEKNLLFQSSHKISNEKEIWQISCRSVTLAGTLSVWHHDASVATFFTLGLWAQLTRLEQVTTPWKELRMHDLKPKTLCWPRSLNELKVHLEEAMPHCSRVWWRGCGRNLERRYHMFRGDSHFGISRSWSLNTLTREENSKNSFYSDFKERTSLKLIWNLGKKILFSVKVSHVRTAWIRWQSTRSTDLSFHPFLGFAANKTTVPSGTDVLRVFLFVYKEHDVLTNANAKVKIKYCFMIAMTWKRCYFRRWRWRDACLNRHAQSHQLTLTVTSIVRWQTCSHSSQAASPATSQLAQFLAICATSWFNWQIVVVLNEYFFPLAVRMVLEGYANSRCRCCSGPCDGAVRTRHTVHCLFERYSFHSWPHHTLKRNALSTFHWVLDPNRFPFESRNKNIKVEKLPNTK